MREAEEEGDFENEGEEEEESPTGLAGVAVGLAAVRTRDGPALNFAGGCAEIKDV
jgi:hypothetical protein